ncbi:hypothetical protein Nepgr_024617 [Nepenthes gracilis]|uniref:Uncharacterized protein n=1 Tax=Nepenthes gracilis TaxID=150966 RepID=A0AAD3T5I8_NEPGR|nr:hypothetical protein Nepgr_024617 [Nepenthes gracilis]
MKLPNFISSVSLGIRLVFATKRSKNFCRFFPYFCLMWKRCQGEINSQFRFSSGVASSRPTTTTSGSNDSEVSILSLRPGLHPRVLRVPSLWIFFRSHLCPVLLSLSGFGHMRTPVS